MTYICHSGGCPGADMEWENEGNKYGIKTIAYSFWNHKHEGKNPKVLTVDELGEGFQHVLEANKTLKRNPQGTYQYVKNLLSRNWFQVKNSESIFAISKFIKNPIVNGGTGWAVQMAVDNKKPVYLFDQENNKWFTFNYETMIFDEYTDIPKLTENFAGIGTREINEYGKQAIKKIYQTNFNSPLV
jgi:hypothetical protein